jgi:hypothetical protein
LDHAGVVAQHHHMRRADDLRLCQRLRQGGPGPSGLLDDAGSQRAFRVAQAAHDGGVLAAHVAAEDQG